MKFKLVRPTQRSIKPKTSTTPLRYASHTMINEMINWIRNLNFRMMPGAIDAKRVATGAKRVVRNVKKDRKVEATYLKKPKAFPFMPMGF